jgi:hypothetical protein
LTPKQLKRVRRRRERHRIPINKGRKQHANGWGETRKIQISKKRLGRSTIADEMRLFVAPVASVAFSR